MILAVVLCIAPVRAALACSCVVDEPFEWHMDVSTWVFKGTALATNREWLSLDSDSHQTRFQVGSVVKGAVTKEVVIHHGVSGPSCGFRFEEGQTYIVLANKYRGRYYTGSCSQNAVRQYADEFEEAFERDGYAPFEQLAPDFWSWENFERTVIFPFLSSPWIAVITVLSVLLLRFLWRRRKNRPLSGRN